MNYGRVPIMKETRKTVDLFSLNVNVNKEDLFRYEDIKCSVKEWFVTNNGVSKYLNYARYVLIALLSFKIYCDSLTVLWNQCYSSNAASSRSMLKFKFLNGIAISAADYSQLNDPVLLLCFVKKSIFPYLQIDKKTAEHQISTNR